MKVGVLALQGAFREHQDALRQLDVEVVTIRKPEELIGLDGLIIPGGESTTIIKLMDLYGLRAPIVDAYEDGMAIFGTCAGAIVLAREVEGAKEGQKSLGIMDVEIARNAYGRQVDSFETTVSFSGVKGGEVGAVFIRAPRFCTLGKGVSVLAKIDDEPVAVRQRRLLATAFHPELTGDLRVHSYFIQKVIGS